MLGGRKPILIVAFIMMFTANLFADEISLKQGDLLYSWINDLRMKDDKGKTLTRLKEYEGVIYLGTHSKKKRSVVLRGKKLLHYDYLIKTDKGITGWVYGGALKHVTGIKPVYSEAAQVCLAMSSRDGGPKRLVTKRQKVIDGSKIYSYLGSLNKGQEIYKRPIYESGCVGTLEEKCYTNNLVVEEFEGGSGTTLFGEFPPILGIVKGMTKAAVMEKLGQPRKQNQKLFIYQSFYFLKQKDYQVTVDYYINLFFDDSEKVDSIKINTHYHEDC